MGVFRNPPWSASRDVFLAHQLEDVVDWGLLAQNIDRLRELSRGSGVMVGVCDTGRPNHPDLAAKVRHSANFSNDTTDLDLSGHGTHVAGVIGAAENGVGIVGVAPDVDLCIAKVLGRDGSGSGAQVAKGIRFCIVHGCRIICMSLGNGRDEELEKAVQEGYDAGVMFICAAGNSGRIDGINTVNWPARMKPQTLAIGSYTRDGQIAKHSAAGPEVDFACPGEDILSCWLDGNYRKLSGTSMAAPFMAGIAALLLAKQQADHRANRPVLHPLTNTDALRTLIQQVALDRGPKGHDDSWGWGVVDVQKLLQ